MERRYQHLAEQAREAVRQGREDLARAALLRRAALEAQVATLKEQHAALQAQEERLGDNQQRLAGRIEAFRMEKETTKATYAASQAQVRANEAVAGIGQEMADVGQTLQRARDRVAQMHARAAATDELLASGALEDLAGLPDADLDRQLAEDRMPAAIEREIEALKRELQPGGEERGSRALPPREPKRSDETNSREETA